VWAASGTATKATPANGLRTFLLVVWVIGAVLSVAVLLAGLARLKWLTSQSAPVTDGPWRQLADDVARRFGLSAPVRLVQSRHPTLLATWGIRRPVILLPAEAEGWMSDRIAIVLAHELAHVARWDWVVLVVANTLRAAFWFNPLLWSASRRLHRESELACDDQVLALGTTGADYASHLCDLARLLRSEHGRGLPVAPMTPAAHLQERIHAMLVPSSDRRTVSATLRTTSLMVGLAATLFVAAAAAQSSFHSVAGVVRDATHRVLPSARLVMTHLGNQSKYEVRSNAEGRYEFVGLPAATYRLDVGVPGFTPVTAEWVVSATAVRDIQLEVGSLEETMTVRDTAPASPDAATLEKATLQFGALRTRALEVCANPARNAAVGGNIMPPKKLLHVQPVYAQSLRDAGVGGVVTMTATIGTDGLVRDIDDLTGPHPELASAAEQAVRQWQFSQTWLNCEAIDVRMRVTTNFVPQ
jgi:beta-lactamase regulating signal transducer with metallopeptidase domain